MEKAEELELVAKASKGDNDAFRLLYEEYYSRVYNLSFSIMRRHEEAEEVLQEAFVKAFRGLKNFKGDSSFYTWLYRIVRNMAIDVKRKKARRIQIAYDEPDLSRTNSADAILTGSVLEPEAALESKQTLNQLQQALGQLKEEQRTVLVLREIEGMSYDEIAKVCDLSGGTVMSRLFYARKSLKKILLADAAKTESMLNNNLEFAG